MTCEPPPFKLENGKEIYFWEIAQVSSYSSSDDEAKEREHGHSKQRPQTAPTRGSSRKSIDAGSKRHRKEFFSFDSSSTTSNDEYRKSHRRRRRNHHHHHHHRRDKYRDRHYSKSHNHQQQNRSRHGRAKDRRKQHGTNGGTKSHAPSSSAIRKSRQQGRKRSSGHKDPSQEIIRYADLLDMKFPVEESTRKEKPGNSKPSGVEEKIKQADRMFANGRNKKKKDERLKRTAKSKVLPHISREDIDEGAKRLAQLDLDEHSIRFSRKKRRETRTKREKARRRSAEDHNTSTDSILRAKREKEEEEEEFLPPPLVTTKSVSFSQDEASGDGGGTTPVASPKVLESPRKAAIVQSTHKTKIHRKKKKRRARAQSVDLGKGNILKALQKQAEEGSKHFGKETQRPKSKTKDDSRKDDSRKDHLRKDESRKDESHKDESPVISDVRRNERRMSLVRMASSGAFTIRVGKDTVTGCDIWYTDESESTLYSRNRASGRMLSPRLDPSRHRVCFLCLEDMFEILEKRHLDTGNDRGGDFDPDDYKDLPDDEGITPVVLKGVEIFRYSDLMGGDNAWSFENSTRMVRARDVYERLLQDCSIHGHPYVGYVLACLAVKVSIKRLGEIVKDQHARITKDYMRTWDTLRATHVGEFARPPLPLLDSMVAGCVFPNRYCPYFEETQRLKEDLAIKRDELTLFREQSRESMSLARSLSEKMEDAVKEKIVAQRELEVQKLECIDLEKLLENCKDQLELTKQQLEIFKKRLHIAMESLAEAEARGKPIEVQSLHG